MRNTANCATINPVSGRLLTYLLTATTFPVLPVVCQDTKPEPRTLNLVQPLRDKNFWLLSALAINTPVARLLADDQVLSSLRIARAFALARAVEKCSTDATCYASLMRWSDEEILSARERLKVLYQEDENIRQLTEEALRKSGVYHRYAEQPGADLLASAWDDCARGINRIIDYYALGLKPRYAEIDA
ncbi:MAG: hypothetical protein H7039_08270, partial [Bryobacteraceae bacterium]|nr:hypothetical protein [Bryobacteraceae bacterium]